MTEAQPTLNSLAAKITELAANLTKRLEANKVPVPTFSPDGPARYDTAAPDVFMLRQELLENVKDLEYLTQGPTESIMNYAHTAMPDAACLNVLNFFDFWSAVPLDGSASYEEIAAKIPLPREVIYRVIQHATTLRIFDETEPGKKTSRIRHTARSAALARNPGLRGLVSTVMDVSGGPMMVLHEALNRYTKDKPALTEETTETSFALFHSGGQLGKHATTWDMLENDGEGEQKGWRQRTFVDFMTYIKELFDLEGVLRDSIDWSAIGSASVVDVAGSAGHDAFVLAKKFPELSITVQDLPECGPVFAKNLPEDLKSRVSFVKHNMFDPQPVQADIYILKMILHDWSDKAAAEILRALIPALKPGARVILIEYIATHDEITEGPPPLRIMKQYGTATDLRIMSLFNAKARTVGAWKNVVKAADERFELASVKHDPVTFFATIEAVWRG